MAFVSVISSSSLSRLASNHAAFVLLVTWGVYFYRDAWPLATVTLQPRDAAEGLFLWLKFAVLTVAAIVVPIFSPRAYTPVDPKVRSLFTAHGVRGSNSIQDPMPEPNPEQTASIFSMSIYTFLDGIIFKAYRMPHLPWEELPPLADYDYAKNLVNRSFPVSHLRLWKICFLNTR